MHGNPERAHRATTARRGSPRAAAGQHALVEIERWTGPLPPTPRPPPAGDRHETLTGHRPPRAGREARKVRGAHGPHPLPPLPMLGEGDEGCRRARTDEGRFSAGKRSFDKLRMTNCFALRQPNVGRILFPVILTAVERPLAAAIFFVRPSPRTVLLPPRMPNRLPTSASSCSPPSSGAVRCTKSPDRLREAERNQCAATWGWRGRRRDVGRRHAANIARSIPEARLAAVADVRPDAAKAVAAEYGAPKWFTSAEELAADPDVERS